VSIYKRGRVWWLYVVTPHGGPRVRRSTGERERARAQRIHDELKAALWKRKRGRSLHAALDAWVADQVGPDVYRVAILKKKIEDQDIGDIDPHALSKLIPASSVGTYLRYRTILRAAGVLGLPNKKPPKGRIRWLTAEEWDDLREALPDHQRPMAELAIATGLRQANIFRLEWKQVDFARKKAWIHADQAKGGEPIGIALNKDAIRVLKAQQKRTGGGRWVFVGKGGEDPPTEIKTAWKRACKAVGLEDFTWHDLRHTWASWHLMNGTELGVLKELGGWKDLRMVMRYAHLAKSHVDDFAGNAKPYQPRHISRHTKKLSA